MISIYGRVYSRALSVLWAAKEMYIRHNQVSVAYKLGDTAQPEYLEIKPNGKISVILDDD